MDDRRWLDRIGLIGRRSGMERVATFSQAAEGQIEFNAGVAGFGALGTHA